MGASALLLSSLRRLLGLLISSAMFDQEMRAERCLGNADVTLLQGVVQSQLLKSPGELNE
jgi:hypothetical protein